MIDFDRLSDLANKVRSSVLEGSYKQLLGVFSWSDGGLDYTVTKAITVGISSTTDRDRQTNLISNSKTTQLEIRTGTRGVDNRGDTVRLPVKPYPYLKLKVVVPDYTSDKSLEGDYRVTEIKGSHTTLEVKAAKLMK